MISKSLLTLGLFFIILTAGAQDMKEGFTLLETGQFAKAETYFFNVLKEYPENKTARLCYGRAVGLSGGPEKAIKLFENLLADFPEDYEVKLNYGESLLWNNKFTDAKTYYQKLIKEDAKSFPALLGYANTLSNLKTYEEALVYIDKALAVSVNNPSALTSKKYIYLGFAYQNQQAQNFEKAEELLQKNLTLFKEDKETLLNLANLYLITSNLEGAKEAYVRIAKQDAHKTTALNGLALVAHLKGDSKKALALSTEAYNSLQNTTDKTVLKQTTERYIQALIWNKKFKEAALKIEGINADPKDDNWVTALRATLAIYRSNFTKSLNYYDKILKKDSASFDGNLGKANTLKALGKNDGAYAQAEKTLTFYENQKDAVNFINQLNTTFSPVLETKAAYSFDNGNNNAFSVNNNVVYPLSTKFSLLGNYNYRTTKNDVTDNNASSNDFTAGIAYELFPRIIFKGIAGITATDTKTNNYTQFLTNVALHINAFKLQNLEVGYKRNLENFNADLMTRELVQNNLYANYNISTNVGLGWFTQYIYTTQSDENRRNLLFTSLYYNVMNNPLLKVGLNYQYIAFKDQLPTVYFSPERFNTGEVFINLMKDENTAKPKSTFYNLNAAFGYQFIEDQARQGTYRFQAAFGYKFSERSIVNLYGLHSNIASASAAGFTFSEVGLRFKWTILSKPVFRK